jgi:ribosome assembly protein 4
MDGMVCIWDYTNNRIIGRPLKGHTKWITSLAWEPLHLNNECTLLASSSKDGTIRLWSRNNNICLITIVAS